MSTDYSEYTREELILQLEVLHDLLRKSGDLITNTNENWRNIVVQQQKDIAEADKSAGTAWRLLRRYKYKVRELNKKIEALEKGKCYE